MSSLPTLPLPYRLAQPREQSASPALLILLHGYGSNEHDLIALAPYLPPQLLIIAARAPYVLGPGSYAWFDLEINGPQIGFDLAQAETSRQTLFEFVEAASTSFPVNQQHILIGGFSQGGIMTLSVALHQPQRFSGAMVLSGAMRPQLISNHAPAEQLTSFPMLVQHGLYDQVLPIHHGRAIRDTLAALPVQLEYHEYPMAHEISHPSLRDLVHWVNQRLSN